MALGLLVEAETVIHELGNAGIYDAVVDVDPMSAGAQNAKIHQTPKLVRDRLGLHVDRVGEVTHARVVQQN
jgi:hypothetical protein